MCRHPIPCDAIYLDIDHMDGKRIFTWDRERFPDPAGLIADLGAQGFKVVPIVGVGVKHQPEGGYRIYDEGAAGGYFIKTSRDVDAEDFLCYVWPGLCAFPDFTRAEAREWWGGCYRELLEAGAAGFWNDMNEPAMHDKPYDDPASASISTPARMARPTARSTKTTARHSRMSKAAAAAPSTNAASMAVRRCCAPGVKAATSPPRGRSPSGCMVRERFAAPRWLPTTATGGSR